MQNSTNTEEKGNKSCVICGNVTQYRYCSKACKQKAYRNNINKLGVEKNSGGTGAEPPEVKASNKINLDDTELIKLFHSAREVLQTQHNKADEDKMTMLEFIFLFNMWGGKIERGMFFLMFIQKVVQGDLLDQIRAGSYNAHDIFIPSYDIGKAFYKFEKQFYNRHMPNDQ
jgi:hypothetical protein